MNAQELWIKKDNNYVSAGVWACETCKLLSSDKELTDQCCKNLTCEVCGKTINKKRGEREPHFINPIRCADCYKQQKEDEKEVIEEKDYTGSFFYGDTFYADVDNLISGIELETEEDIPDYLDVAEEVEIQKINPARLLEDLYESTDLEDCYNDMFVATDELFDFFEKWNAKQTFTYYILGNKKVRLSEKTKQELKDLLKD